MNNSQPASGFIVWKAWVFCAKFHMKHRFLVSVILISFSLSATSNECAERHNESYQKLTFERNDADLAFYGNVPQLLNFKPEDDIHSVFSKMTGDQSPQYWQVVVTCKQDDAIFFSLAVAGSVNKYLDGVVVLDNSKYFAGPLSLLPEGKTIIQADKL